MSVAATVDKYNRDKTRLLDIFWELQQAEGFVSPEQLAELSWALDMSIPELRDTLTFYHFFHDQPAGRQKVFVDTSIIAEFSGLDQIIHTFERELGCKIGTRTTDGQFGLYPTSCIGMSDQSPAALVDGFPVVNLTPEKVEKLVTELKQGRPVIPDVSNRVHLQGPVLLQPWNRGESLQRLAGFSASQIIEEVSRSGIRGRGGAGFSTGLKWELCAGQSDPTRYIVCNADEGEPGTFKDRYLLTKTPGLLFEGMIIAARAMAAAHGLVYLRAEYRYLLDHLRAELQILREQNLLGEDILGIDGFNFDIRIQLGAGAYVVGEETALLESLEGKRGEPRVRPPFPVEAGYLGKPTIVNNVETFASVARIIQHGADWYRGFGTEKSPGTKLLSVSGDCDATGIYEIEWGMSIGQFIDLVGARDPMAIQVGGPSGVCLNAADRERKLCFEDLPTGGSMMVFGKQRKLLSIVKNFVQFFVNESCGCCLPCRAGNIVLNEQIDKIIDMDGAAIDLERIKSWSAIISPASRCGLGQSCVNPMLTSIESFPEIYRQSVREHEPQFRFFDLESKLKAYEQAVDNAGHKRRRYDR